MLTNVFRRSHLGKFLFSSGHSENLGKPESKVFFESVTTTVKGFLHSNYIVEHNPNLTEADKANMKRFLVYRYNPEDPDDKPKYVSYYIDLKKIPPMYLDAILYIKDNLDSTLSLRRSCR